MYKALGVAVLLLPTFALAQGSKSVPATTFSSPQIVAKAKLPHQTAAIPTTTIYTPTLAGLYRLSVYATLLSAPCVVGGNWNFNLGWTDDAGAQSINSLLWGYDCNLGQFQQGYWFVNGTPTGGPVTTFEATAGQPITYGVSYQGEPDGTAYSLYYTLERLE